jgi:hypothetical protein
MSENAGAPNDPRCPDPTPPEVFTAESDRPVEAERPGDGRRPWSADTFLGAARELTRRLRVWHCEDPRYPTQFASPREAGRWVRLSFRELLTEPPGVRPWRGIQLFAHDEEDRSGSDLMLDAYEDAEIDSDPALTQWILDDFRCHVAAEEGLPALEHLRTCFDRLLDQQAWAIRPPRNDWERGMAAYERDEQGEERCYVLVGREVPSADLEALVDAAEKLVTAAPPVWSARVHDAPSVSDHETRPLSSTPAQDGDDQDQAETHDIRHLVAWLKRVTPEWPPMGIDWPLVLSAAERVLTDSLDDDDGDCAQPADGQGLDEFLRGSVDTEELRAAKPLDRAYALTSQLLDVYGLLEALCTASLFMGYDLDAIEQPVKRLPPFHGLMCLGVVVLGLVRCLRDLSQSDVETATEPAAEPIQLGAAFGRNMHQAVWNLADEICRISDSVTEGRRSVQRLSDEPPGTMEHAWWRLSETLTERLPNALEVKKAQVQLDRESRDALARTALRLSSEERDSLASHVVAEATAIRSSDGDPQERRPAAAHDRSQLFPPAADTAPQASPVVTRDDPADRNSGNTLSLSGDVWEIQYREGDNREVGHFKDRRDSALRRLARVLAEPNRRFRATDFYPPPPGRASIPYLGRDTTSDAAAIRNERAAAERLAQDIKEADDAHDTETAARLRKDFAALTEHLRGESAARKRGHKKRCGNPSPQEKAQQALYVALERAKGSFRTKGMPKLAAHLDAYLNCSGGQWYYAPPPGTLPWQVHGPGPSPEN